MQRARTPGIFTKAVMASVAMVAFGLGNTACADGDTVELTDKATEIIEKKGPVITGSETIDNEEATTIGGFTYENGMATRRMLNGRIEYRCLGEYLEATTIATLERFPTGISINPSYFCRDKTIEVGEFTK